MPAYCLGVEVLDSTSLAALDPSLVAAAFVLDLAFPDSSANFVAEALLGAADCSG